MSLQAVANQFVELCNQGRNFDVMHTMYDPDIVSVEGDGTETRGKAAVIQKSERWAADHTIHGETVRGPYFNGLEEFAVHITFDVTRNAGGQRKTLEEVAIYTVKGDKITWERFFYSGSWGAS
ncbi:MAG: ketosteroid isomerase [Planctomycetota bacterium]|nr:MAG: ketosteroid isomerase [Planctomycetota bacterium]